LQNYILSCQANGLRLVLVITGKGSSDAQPYTAMAMPRGVLRQQVPRWLAMPPLSIVVQQVAQAHATHGGGGALYVYLRRR
jgi:DNA-nicking Smr family endonuclease